MGIFDKIKQKEPEMEGEEYVELDFDEGKPQKQVLIHIEKLMDFADTDRIMRKVRDGNIILVKIKELKSKDITELKRSIEKIRKTCTAIDGDVAGIGEEWLIITPSYARVHREAE